MNYYELLIRRHFMQSASGGESGLQLRITSSETVAGCAQVYNLTSGDASTPPNKIGNPWIFTGVTDSAWTIMIQYNEVGPDTDIIVRRNGMEMYHTTVGKEWIDLADAVSNISSWMDSNTATIVDMTLIVVSGGGDDHEYVYTVAGAGYPEANGDYWDSGEMYDGTYPIYTNGEWKMYQYDPLGYCIDNQVGYSVYTSMTGFTSGWSTNGYGGEPAPTVAEYNGSSSGGGGDSGGSKNYNTLTISGSGETSANVTYIKTSESDSSIKYTQDGGYGELTITKEFNAGGTGYTALIQWNSKPCYNCGFDTLDDLETASWYTIAASEPLPTVKYGG
jgi:hypothetical protein